MSRVLTSNNFQGYLIFRRIKELKTDITVEEFLYSRPPGLKQFHPVVSAISDRIHFAAKDLIGINDPRAYSSVPACIKEAVKEQAMLFITSGEFKCSGGIGWFGLAWVCGEVTHIFEESWVIP